VNSYRDEYPRPIWRTAILLNLHIDFVCLNQYRIPTIE